MKKTESTNHFFKKRVNMGSMSDVAIDIEEMLDEGYRPITISALLNVPVTWVYDVAELQQTESNTEVYNPYNTVNS
jgi:hypothetical protein